MLLYLLQCRLWRFPLVLKMLLQTCGGGTQIPGSSSRHPNVLVLVSSGISDLLLFVSCFASQSEGMKFGE